MNWKDKYYFIGPLIPKDCLRYRRMDRAKKDAVDKSTPEQKITRKWGQDSNLRSWSKKIKERDGYKCTECGATNHLHSHHIKSKATHPELKYDMNNGITLCYDCHINAHINDSVSKIMTNNKRYSRRVSPRG